MGFGNSKPPAPTTQPFGIQDQMTANNQQATPVAYVAGTRRIAAKWMSPLYNLRAKPAPNKIPSKK